MELQGLIALFLSVIAIVFMNKNLSVNACIGIVLYGMALILWLDARIKYFIETGKLKRIRE